MLIFYPFYMSFMLQNYFFVFIDEKKRTDTMSVPKI